MIDEIMKELETIKRDIEVLTVAHNVTVKEESKHIKRIDRNYNKLVDRIDDLEVMVHNSKKDNNVIDDDYIIIRIPKNASNFDVLRKVFNCKITKSSENCEVGIAHVDIDGDTLFNTSWLKTKYKGGADNASD